MHLMFKLIYLSLFYKGWNLFTLGIKVFEINLAEFWIFMEKNIDFDIDIHSNWNNVGSYWAPVEMKLKESRTFTILNLIANIWIKNQN